VTNCRARSGDINSNGSIISRSETPEGKLTLGQAESPKLDHPHVWRIERNQPFINVAAGSIEQRAVGGDQDVNGRDINSRASADDCLLIAPGIPGKAQAWRCVKTRAERRRFAVRVEPHTSIHGQA